MADLNLEYDYLIFDNNDTVSGVLGTVTYTSVNNTLNRSFTVSGVSMKLEDRENEKVPTHGVYIKREAYFQLPIHPFQLQSPVIIPKVSDKIADADGSVWLVMKVKEPIFGDCWRCHCIEVILESDLTTLVSIYRPSCSLDDFGSKVTSLQPLHLLVDARVQHERDEIVDIAGVRAFKKWHTIYIDIDYESKWGDIVVDNAGINYFVTNNSNLDRIDELNGIECYITPIGT